LGKRSRSKHEIRAGAPASQEALPRANGSLRTLIVCIALVLAVTAIYAQVRTHSFINYDDPEYVSHNEHVLTGLTRANVVWAFTSVHAAYWHPITWITHMIDVSLFGAVAGRHLLVNVLIHALNSILLFFWLRSLTGAYWRSAAVAALFAVHPLHVESVAWIAERKDVLSALFMLLALIAYTHYARTRSRLSYAGSILALILGLLSKPMLVTFPFVLLLLDWWPLKRRALLEKIPFFAAVVPIIAVTLSTQSVAMTGGNVSLSIRLANAVISYVKYVAKSAWPTSLAIIYPYSTTVSLIAAIACAIVLLVITLAIWMARNDAPWLFVGWFWFVGTLVPVIGLVQVGRQSMADRFTYIPHIGLFIAVVWSCARLIERTPQLRTVAAAATVAILVAYAAVAHSQTAYWSDSVTLFSHTVAVTSNNNLARINLGAALLETGAADQAEVQYRAADGFQPADVQHLGLALALSAQGKTDEAAYEAETAVKANGSNREALATLGMLELSRGHNAQAAAALERAAALRHDPLVMARLAQARGNGAEARKLFGDAARQFESADAHQALATELAREGDDAGAAREYETAVRLDAKSYDTRMNFGAVLSRLGKDEEATRQFNEASILRPTSAEPHIYVAVAEANHHRLAEAIEHLQRAIEINHDDANRLLTNAIRITPNPMNIDRYIAFLRQQATTSNR
jgi:tetratricopeptide (TPR) repeat protein